MSDLLFHQTGDLSDVLRGQTEKMKATIADTSPERMNGGSDEELVAHFVSEYSIEPLTIYTDRAEAEHQETKVDVSHDRFRFVLDRSKTAMVKGDQITVHVPFTGEPDLFKFTPSTRTYNPPRGRVTTDGELSGRVSLTLALPSDTNDESAFNTWIEEQLNGLRQYAEWVDRDVEHFNKELEQHARKAVQARREQLEKQGTLLKRLSIPLKSRADAPDPTPIPMPKRVVKPLPPSRKVEQEYGITDEDYEYILRILRQESRSFESTPAAFAKLNEEELRDIVLAHLNGHFEGGAAGERLSFPQDC